MKIVALGEAKQTLSEVINTAQAGENILVTRHGKPVALIVGTGDYSMDDFVAMGDRALWQLIEERRKTSKVVSAEEARRLVGAVSYTVCRYEGDETLAAYHPGSRYPLDRAYSTRLAALRAAHSRATDEVNRLWTEIEKEQAAGGKDAP